MKMEETIIYRCETKTERMRAEDQVFYNIQGETIKLTAKGN